MPIYKYQCPNCGTTVEELRSIADRDKEILCPQCSTNMKRQFSASFGVEFVTVTGLAKFSSPLLNKTVYYEKHDNWVPPKEYLEKKTRGLKIL